MDIVKTAYSSSFGYPEIVYNNLHTIASNGTLSITIPGFTGIAYVKVWGELFPGEYSAVFTSSTQYTFTPDYDTAGIFGFRVTIGDGTITIINDCTSSKNVYVRAYRRE